MNAVQRPMMLFLKVFLLIQAALWCVAQGAEPQKTDKPPSFTKPASNEWANVTNNLGGETWGYAGVTLMAAAPNSVDVIAGVSERGLWSSSDGGATWKKLGADDKEPIKHRPHRILFDPKDPSVY